MFELKEIQAKETLMIRQMVLRPGMSLNECIYDIDYQEGTFHLGVFLDEKLVSIASFSKEINYELPRVNQYRLRGMATIKEYRNLGAGRLVVEHAETMLKHLGVDLLWCNGRTGVQEYYERIGFQPYGEVFSYPPSGPHIVMYKLLK